MATAKQKAAGICENCGKAVAVFHSEDGAVVPIGSRGGCACGSSEFRLL